jgi:hypothetical protein
MSSLSRGKNVLLVLVNLVARIPNLVSLTQLTIRNVLLTAVIFVTDKEHITDKPLGLRIRVLLPVDPTSFEGELRNFTFQSLLMYTFQLLSFLQVEFGRTEA